MNMLFTRLHSTFPEAAFRTFSELVLGIYGSFGTLLRFLVLTLFILFSGSLLSGCGNRSASSDRAVTVAATPSTSTAVPTEAPTPVATGSADAANGSTVNTPTPQISTTLTPDLPPIYYTYEVIATFPHDATAFTQGLLFDQGQLYEGTGLYGESTVRRVELATGVVEEQIALPEQYFGEGITIVNGQIYQLTWKEQVGFIYDQRTFEQLGEFSYATQGWGLTFDGTEFIMSDGSDQLYFLDPSTMTVVKQITVSVFDQTDQSRKTVTQINELEYIEGEIFANIWQTDAIVRIDPATGNINGVINLTGLLPAEAHTATTDVLNGIAYLPEGKRLFVTGKKWPTLFEIKLVQQ